MEFGKNYTKYWKSTVNKSVDGTIIAGVEEAKIFLQLLEIEKNNSVLDLGCSFGRMHEALAFYSDKVIGIDPDQYAVDQANQKPYLNVSKGSAENTGLKKDSFNVVFCWAVFDVVSHNEGLREINRILKKGGKLLLSGKNDNYFIDDNLAFKAEKNAYLKEYPNKFTNLSDILSNFEFFGFKLDKLYIFPRRGDMGKINFKEQSNVIKDAYIGYEYVILCHKVKDTDTNNLIGKSFDSPFSKSAVEIANQKGYLSPNDLFNSIGID
mgnify:CR=1 FL=1